MANPYASPFGDTSALRAKAARQDGMDQDEDDDLKVNSSTGRSSRQSAFAHFQKLAASKPDDDSKQKAIRTHPKPQKKKESDGWSVKRSHAAKIKLRDERSRSRSKGKIAARRRANSLPRNTKNSGNADPKNDYIFFHDVAAAAAAKSQKKSIKTKPNKFEALNVETSNLDVAGSKQLQFDALSKSGTAKSDGKGVANQLRGPSVEIHSASYRSIRIPGHRMVHVRRMWAQICKPVVKYLKLQIRMNSVKKIIELRMAKAAVVEDSTLKSRNPIQKGSDFIRAAVMGFELKDALALIRMDDVYLESFDIRDVKFFNKKSDHWMRAIGRIAGQYGKIKYSIENSTNSRIIIFGFKVHILGSFSSIRLARNSISRLVIGSAPGNVYAKLRTVSNRMKHKF